MSTDSARELTRRDFVAAAGAVPLALAAACRDVVEPLPTGPARLRLHGRRPSRGTVTGNDVIVGAHQRRAYLRVPLNYSPGTPTALLIALHGNGGRGDTFSAAFASRTDALGAIVLSPDSASLTWDAVRGDFGIDVDFLNEVLDRTFDRCNIDASRIALLGFSDGASYALSLGIANGDQLQGVVAFSPGFYRVDHPHGTPSCFISHGIRDDVLPIDRTSREIVPALRARGSAVSYVEFDGYHEVPGAIADQGMAWLAARI